MGHVARAGPRSRRSDVRSSQRASLASRRGLLAMARSPSTRSGWPGKPISLARVDVDELGANLRGQLILPGDAPYDDARRLWNGAFNRHPALIARCAGAADVVEAVNFARATGVLTAVRGGGHSISGQSVCDGGLVIDLSPMKGIRVDPRDSRRRRSRACGSASSIANARRSSWPPPSAPPPTPASPVSRSAVAWVVSRANSATRATTCSQSTSSPLTASFCTPTRTRTAISTGPCAAAVATSAW